MDLNEWYGGYVKIPRSFNKSAAAFAASSVTIALSTMGYDRGSGYRIIFHRGDEMLVDVDQKTIYLSSQIFSHDADKRPNPTATPEQAITAVLGVTVHEAAHVLLSPKDLNEFHSISGLEPKTKLSMTFFNLVEDYFVDRYIVDNYPWAPWMLLGAFDYYFKSERLNSIGNLPETLEPGTKITDASLVPILIDNLVFGKNHKFTSTIREKHPYLDWVISQIFDTLDLKDTERRCYEQAAIFKRIFDLKPDEQEFSPSRSKELSGEGENFNLDILKAEGEANYLEDEFYEDPILNAIVQSISRKKVDKLVYTDVPVVYVTPGNEGYGFSCDDIEIDSRYLELSQTSRQLAFKIQPKGVRQPRGHHIKDPSRIITDGRIFASPISKHKVMPIEVIILVDCSGSMSSPARISASLAASLGAAEGLASGRHKVGIWGHSADYDFGMRLPSRQILCIYKVKEFDESIGLAKTRAVCLQSGHYLRQNRDGDAIREVSKYFSTQQNTKALIVISDGEPHADSYTGNYAKADTASAVSLTRSKGIKVMSISIDAYAVPTNNEIYGKDWNVSNSDPNVIEQLLNQLILKNWKDG